MMLMLGDVITPFFLRLAFFLVLLFGRFHCSQCQLAWTGKPSHFGQERASTIGLSRVPFLSVRIVYLWA